LEYKWDDNEDVFYLDCFDEMHNHALNSTSSGSILRPLPSINGSMSIPIHPQFLTPKFFRFSEHFLRDLDQS
jgi:hypothetical protein